MSTRNVVLTEHHEEMIAELVASGRYQNASEVLREGLRLIEQRDAREEARLKALRKAARAGVRDLDERRSELIDDSRIARAVTALGRQARTLRWRGCDPPFRFGAERYRSPAGVDRRPF